MKIPLKSLFLLLSALLAVSVSYSCRKSSDAEPAAEAPADVTPLTVTGRIGGADTKVTYTLESGKISQKWAVGDTIIGIDNASTPKTYTYVVSKVNSDGTASFTFVKGDSRYGTAIDNPSDETTMYMIYAPGYAASNFISNKLTIDISTQDTTNVGTTSASGLHIPAIMTASGTVSSNKLELTFENQLELLMITDPTFSGCAGGTSITSFTVSGSDLPTTATFSASGFTVGTKNGTVTKNCSLTTDSDGKASGTVLIALLPASSQNLIIKSSNSYADTVKSHTPTASSLLKLSGATFNPPAMTGVTISSDSDTIDVGTKDTLTYTVQPTGAVVTSAVWSSSDTTVATVAGGVVTGKGAGKACIIITVNDKFKDTCTVTVKKSVLLPGKFSVSATKKVKFTNGNLYYSSTDGKYHIETAQNVTYSTLGQSAYDATHVCLFFWTSLTDYQTGKTSYMPYVDKFSCSWSTTFYDNFWCGEENKLSVDNQEDLYALTRDEWTYLFSGRNNASNLYKLGVTVTTSAGTVVCVVIAPDSWDYANNPLKSEYTAEEWTKAESAGLMCLPIAGFRFSGKAPQSTTVAYYWSSTSSTSGDEDESLKWAYRLHFTSTAWYTTDSGWCDTQRNSGHSVRLVCTSN